ncbi:MAG: YqjK-like family protein [Gallionella sp.]
MNDHMSELLRRRSELLSRITVQREQVAEFGARLETPLALADKGLAAVRLLRSIPVLSVALAALLVNRRGMVGLVKGAWRLWKGYRKFRAFGDIADATRNS